MNIDQTFTILIAVVIVAVIAAFVYVRRTPPRQEVEMWAIQLVRAAEQLFDGDNASKLDYCMTMIKRVYPRFDADLARSIIEYAVFALKQETAPARPSDCDTLAPGSNNDARATST